MADAGPVLIAGELGRAVAAAIARETNGVVIDDRGSYLRVSAPGGCKVTKSAIEREVGAPFRLPGDLERVMPSFVGRLVLTEEDARWE